MPYKFVADGCHTKKLCSRLSSKELHFYKQNGRFTYLAPLAVYAQRTLFILLGSLECLVA